MAPGSVRASTRPFGPAQQEGSGEPSYSSRARPPSSLLILSRIRRTRVEGRRAYGARGPCVLRHGPSGRLSKRGGEPRQTSLLILSRIRRTRAEGRRAYGARGPCVLRHGPSGRLSRRGVGSQVIARGLDPPLIAPHPEPGPEDPCRRTQGLWRPGPCVLRHGPSGRLSKRGVGSQVVARGLDPLIAAHPEPGPCVLRHGPSGRLSKRGVGSQNVARGLDPPHRASS